VFKKESSRAEAVIAPVLSVLFRLLAPSSYAKRVVAKYSKILGASYLAPGGIRFCHFLGVYRQFIVTAPINRCELFISVVRRSEWEVSGARRRRKERELNFKDAHFSKQ